MTRDTAPLNCFSRIGGAGTEDNCYLYVTGSFRCYHIVTGIALLDIPWIRQRNRCAMSAMSRLARWPVQDSP